MPPDYQGSTYKSQNGLWSWTIKENDLPIVRGTGYNSKDEAEEDMRSELSRYKSSN